MKQKLFRLMLAVLALLLVGNIHLHAKKVHTLGDSTMAPYNEETFSSCAVPARTARPWRPNIISADCQGMLFHKEKGTQIADNGRKISFLLQISKKSSNFALAFSEFKLLNKVLWNNLYIRHGR